MQDVFEDVRDFIILHYKAVRRHDSEFWNYCRTMEVPDSLARKLELWRAKGRLFREGRELFGTASWVAVDTFWKRMPTRRRFTSATHNMTPSASNF